jgi:hypothetical protein
VVPDHACADDHDPHGALVFRKNPVFFAGAQRRLVPVPVLRKKKERNLKKEPVWPIFHKKAAL